MSNRKAHYKKQQSPSRLWLQLAAQPTRLSSAGPSPPSRLSILPAFEQSPLRLRDSQISTPMLVLFAVILIFMRILGIAQYTRRHGFEIHNVQRCVCVSFLELSFSWPLTLPFRTPPGSSTFSKFRKARPRMYRGRLFASKYLVSTTFIFVGYRSCKY